MSKPDRDEMIDTIIEYYIFGWESGDEGDLYEELEDLNRRGCKGLENETLDFLKGEYDNAKECLEDEYGED